MVRKVALCLFVACSACLAPGRTAEPTHANGLVRAAEAVRPVEAVVPVRPPYRLVLRSRSAVVTPERIKDGQTAGGYIEVVQQEADQIVIVLRGAVAAGAEQYKGGSAAEHFDLNQDFEVVATRAAVRPPRLTVSGMLIGSLQSTQRNGGNAEQGPACAEVNSGGQPLMHFCIKPHAITTGQKLFVNDRDGCDMLVAPGPFCLHASYDIRADQPWQHCHSLGAMVGAIFDPDPAFRARWSPVTTPTRGVPNRDFGFTITLHVEEERLPPGVTAGSEQLPPPKKAEQLPPPAAHKEGERR
jgi:hypothetical protein